MSTNPYQKKCMQWKWTSVEIYARSKRRPYQGTSSDSYTNNYGINANFSREQEDAAYTTSLNHDENTWDILNQSANQGIGFISSNKREDMTFKMADREMMHQRGFNPFNPDSNYANDVANFAAPSANR